jgi:hypothetical protein
VFVEVEAASVGLTGAPVKVVRFFGETWSREFRTMEAGIFGVRDKSNNFMWWSNPINAINDPIAGSRPTQLSRLLSPIEFEAGNPGLPGGGTDVFSNVTTGDGFTPMIESIDLLQNGMRINYHFPLRRTRISLEVTLEDNSVLVTVPHNRIVEEDITSERGSVMLTMSLLNSFGAGVEDGGYIIVPDGSGAVIDFNNRKTNAFTYSGKVYGRDYAVSQRMAPPVTQQVYLPVFGIVRERGTNAMLAVAEKGAENATVRAAVAGQRENATSYNVVWFDFTMRTRDSFYIGAGTTSIPIFETGHIRTGDIAVRYFPLSNTENATRILFPDWGLTYSDVALAYRDYLTDYMGVGTRSADMSSSPFYMTVNGGTVKTHSIAGFPVERQTPATTYAQTLRMLDSLRSGGVNNAIVTYNDFNTAGIRRQVSSDVQYSSILGGRGDYRQLNSSVNNYGFSLYPSIGFMDFHRSGRGYGTLRHSSRETTRSRAMQSQYELAFGTPESLLTPWTVLSPFFYDRVFSDIVSSLQSENMTSVSLDRATSMLYSDFSRANPFGYAESGFNRRDSVQLLTDGFKRITDAGISLKASTSANAYALPYVSHISNIPMFSSNFDVFDYDIPFYQTAISGLIPYTTRPFNASADLNRLTLLALVTGTPVHYEFIYESPGLFTDSDYDDLFFAHFDTWVDEALAMYHAFGNIIGDVSNSRIVRHAVDPEQFTRTFGLPEMHIQETEFECGKVIRVNLQTYEVFVNGNPVNTSGIIRDFGNSLINS